MKNISALTRTEILTLADRTFLRGVTWFDETDSTNSQALALCVSGAGMQTPHLVYAESQLSGRGRGANQWWSASGSLTFSVIVDFEELGLSVQQKPLLPLLTGMAILRTGQSVLPDGDFALKWPNDVYLAERKLAGVLIEVSAQSPSHAVIGIGLNVNNSFIDAPLELRATGIALADESAQTHDRLEILRLFLRQLETVVQSFANGDPVLETWPDFCLLTGKQVTLQTGATEVTGVCGGIDPTGALLLETVVGQQRFLGGVVKSWV